MNGMMKWLRRHRCITALAAMLGVAPMMTGCYGTFPLTKAVYDFNGDAFDNEIANQVLFWAFVIFPVYGLASLGDAVIFNLVEFWSGDTLQITEHTLPDGTQVALVPEQENKARLEINGTDGETKTMYFVRQESGEVTVLDDRQQVSGYVVKRPSGSLELQDKNRGAVKILSARAPLVDLVSTD